MCSDSRRFEDSLQIRYVTFSALLPLLVVYIPFFSPLFHRHQTASTHVYVPGLDRSEPHHSKRSESYRYLCLHLTIWSVRWEPRFSETRLQEFNTEPDTRRSHPHFIFLSVKYIEYWKSCGVNGINVPPWAQKKDKHRRKNHDNVTDMRFSRWWMSVYQPWPWAPRPTCGIHYSCVVFALISAPLLDFIMFVLSVPLSHLPPAALLIECFALCCRCNRRSVARPLQRQLQYWTRQAQIWTRKALKMKCGLLCFILNIDDNWMLNGIPFSSMFYLTLLFFCEPFDPD